MRLLMITNQLTRERHAGFQETYEGMVQSGELTSFGYVMPVATAAVHGRERSRAELLRAGEAARPDVVLVMSPRRHLNHERGWITHFLRSCGDPVVLYAEHDPWHRWGKPINRSVRGWLAVADIVFTVAREPQVSLFRRAGARDVRFVPHTYCPVQFGEAERTDPLHHRSLSYDAVVVGGGYARWGRVSRLPGAVQRAGMVRKLQRCRDLRVAIYGAGWSGRGAKGVLPYPEQTTAIREGLMSVNWDHFPRHESYVSDRLPISLLAGRVHVTTEHRGLDWLPGEDAGLFFEPSVSAILKRVRALAAAPVEEVLAMGAACHRWVRGRLSEREAARFMLAGVDERLLTGLPAEPWLGFASEWPK